MKVVFPCPTCETPAQTSLTEPHDWRCLGCGYALHLAAATSTVSSCAVCACPDLFKKKDFPHALGLILLVAAFAASAVTYYYFQPTLTWVILIGTAAFDTILYMLVGDAIVCYRCNAHHKGFSADTSHPAFELTTGERYRQERLRREQMKTTKT